MERLRSYFDDDGIVELTGLIAFRRRERAMQRFSVAGTLQKFAAAHAAIHNHFNHDRHLNRRDILKQKRSAALAEWRKLVA